MNLLEVHVKVQEGKQGFYREGSLRFDCGLLVSNIHFSQSQEMLFVNYPAIRDKYKKFHPSFQLRGIQADNSVKDILRAAWNITQCNGGCSVYGYRKAQCIKDLENLSADDFEWSSVKQVTDVPSSGIQQFPLKVDLFPKKNSSNMRRQAYASLFFGDEFAIFNVQVFEQQDGTVTVQFPRNTGSFFTVPDSIHVEKRIVETFHELPALYQEPQKDPQEEESEEISTEEFLFRVLWSASENGYILQSEIQQVLERNQIDWKNIYQVSSIPMLVEKMDFLSLRQLESTPEHYVNWVSISHEKKPSSTITVETSKPVLTDKLKEQIRQVLTELYQRNGKIDLSTIIPYLREKYPEIADRLPRLKLKTILLDCEFVKFEGGPMPPVYVHILGVETAFEQKYQEDMTVALKGCDALPGELAKTQSTVPLPETVIAKTKTLATKNPFALVPNTKLIAGHNLPDIKIPKIETGDAMRRFFAHSRLGRLDCMDLEIVYWISNMQYAKSSILNDLISGGLIPTQPRGQMNRNKLNVRIIRLYKDGLIDIYYLCSVNKEGNITGRSAHRLLMITPQGRTHLRAIGRRSDFDYFMALDNIEMILNKLSINQWFAKFILHFKAFSNYYLNTVATARIAEANAARIGLIMDYGGIPVFVSAVRRGMLHEMDIKSGDFAFWIQRVSNLLKNYQNLYIENKSISFVKQPIVIFIGEDAEHCAEIFQQLCDIAAAINDKTLLDMAWFTEDIDIYNQFLYAHYRFDSQGNHISASINEHLEEEINDSVQVHVDFISEESPEEDIRIFNELDKEEQETKVIISL